MADNNNNIKINRVNGVPFEDTELKNNVNIMNNELTAQIDQKASDIDLSIERNRIDNLVTFVESENGEVEIIIDPTTDNNVEIKDTFGKEIDDLKNEINVERNRMNSISSLSEGSTTGDAELIDIRTGADGTVYDNAGSAVREQVKDLSSQIKENESYMYTTIRKNITYETNNFPVITFIDDDGNSAFLELVKPIFDKYGIKGSLGIVTNNINNTNYLTEKHLYDLQDEGYSILSHTKSHAPEVFKAAATDLSTVTNEAILKEYAGAYNWLKSRGFKGADILVYPWGSIWRPIIKI